MVKKGVFYTLHFMVKKKCVLYTTLYGKKKGVFYTLHFMVNIWTLVPVTIMLKNRLKKLFF